MEVMQILFENNCEDDVIIAGILHDTKDYNLSLETTLKSRKIKE